MRKFTRISLPVIALVFMAFVESPSNKYFEISKNIEIFTNLYKELNLYYVDEVDPAKLMRVGVDAMLQHLDPYTNYFSENQIEGWRFMSEGRYEGLGAETKIIDNYLTITDLIEGAPAETSGLKIGDQIVKVDGRSTEGKNEQEVEVMMRTVPSPEINLEVKRIGVKKPLAITLTRADIKDTNVPYHGMVAEGIGYVILTTFTQDAGKNIGDAIRDLKRQDPELKGVILDLRDNGGGLLREAVNICNLFVPKDQLVVTTRGKVKEWDREFKTTGIPQFPDLPVTVLVNKMTASASEIVSGVLQDYDRGIIIGQRTYGKGLVQNTRDIGYNSQLKLTTAKYYIPSGRCIQSVAYKDGEPVDVPDDQRTAFKTRNGRAVLDGGGVTPDVRMDHADIPDLLDQLEQQNMIFKYVNAFVSAHESIGDPQSFQFTDLAGFRQFLTTQGFTYHNPAYRKLDDALKVMEKDSISTYLTDLARVQQELTLDNDQQFARHEDVILETIASQIVSRYYPEKDKILYKLRQDGEVKKAVDILRDASNYRKILDGK
ncbi:MAG: S41 family peptidase [Saprospiraceae bacterium]|nr:S41 family peptidase [Saprospiraceae bacterium]